MRYPAVISLVFTLSSSRPRTSPPAKFHKHWPSCCSPPTSTRPHCAGRITFTLLYGRYRTNNIRDVRIWKETVQRILQANRCSLVARSATHGCSFYLAQSGLRLTSIQTYMAAIRHMHIEAGLDPPAREQWHQVNYVLRGIRRAQSTTHRRTRLPVTADVMRAIQGAVFSPARERSELEGHLLWAACGLGFFGFLRSGEFTVKDPRHEAPLLASDMAVDSHSHPATIRLHIQKAKSDPFGKGIFIFLELFQLQQTLQSGRNIHHIYLLLLFCCQFIVVINS